MGLRDGDGSGWIGKLVYRSYTPAKAGKVVELVHPRWREETLPDGRKLQEPFCILGIRWLDGKYTQEKEIGIRDYRQLLDDHKRKVKTHRAMIRKLELL